MLGVVLVLIFRVFWWLGFLGAVIMVAGLIIKSIWVLPVAILGAVLLGLGVGSAHAGARSAYTQLYYSQVTLAGKLKEDPGKTASGSASLQLTSVSISGNSFPGTVLVTTRAPTAIARGQFVTVSGVIKPGFGSFPASISSATILLVRETPLDDVGRVVRDWFASKVRLVIPEPQASLGVGFLTGQKSALPTELSDALKIVGLTHIVVASGYNLTVLVGLSRKVFHKVSKYLSAVTSVVMIVSFMFITGLSPSMSRAGLVSGLSILAWYYGRSFHPLVLLPLAAALTVAYNPSYAWGDLGWQLSFAAFCGVMVVGPLVHSYFFGSAKASMLRQLLVETVSAHAVTLPIIALSFGIVSNIAIIANILVVPLVPLAMLLTFITGVWSSLGLGFVWLIAAPTNWLLTYMTTVATFFSKITWAQMEVTKTAWVWFVYGLFLFAAVVWMWKASRHRFTGVVGEQYPLHG